MNGAIRIGDPAIEVRIRRNATARRMILRVSATGRGPVLTLPSGLSLQAASAFLREHEGWLRSRLAEQTRRVVIADGLVLPFGDGKLTVTASGERRLTRDGDQLLVPGTAADLPVKVAAYLREAARAACAEATRHHAAKLGRRPGPITLRDPRSRWGSCNSRGGLMYSWRLILAPTSVLDYVVAHEVAHLAELNHSDRFWAEVRNLRPDFAQPRDWLRRNGSTLHTYDFTRREDA